MNLTADMITEIVYDFSKEDNSQSEMSVVVVMSHGDEGVLYGSDGLPVQDEALLTMFNNQNAPQLKGKPKFFVFAHCR